MKNPSQYHIQKRKDGRYVVTVMFKGQRQVIYGRTKKETLEKLTKAIKEIQYAKIHNLQNFSAATTTLSNWATECVETYSKEYVRGSTYYSYKNIIKSHLGDLGNIRLADITNLMVQSHLLSLRNLATGEKLSPKMLINVRNFISPVFNYAIAPPKTEASVRNVYIIDALKLELLAYKDKMIAWKEEHGFQHSENDFLFTSGKNTAIEPRRFYQYYEELLDVAGIEDATFHSLRHTFATSKSSSIQNTS